MIEKQFKYWQSYIAVSAGTTFVILKLSVNQNEFYSYVEKKHY